MTDQSQHPADSGNFDTSSVSPTHETSGESLSLSEYTKALIKTYLAEAKLHSVSPTKISVSQTVSFLAFLYEKMRNAVEFREENLIRRAAIERIIKRRMVLNENGRNIAELVIKELLWARYYENNTIGEEKIGEVQTIIDKYFFIRNEMTAGRSNREQDKIASFILEVLSCEIEENLSPNHKREAFINFVYHLIRPRIADFNENGITRDIQVYIAVEKVLVHYDHPQIRYDLLKLMLPEITVGSWKTTENVLPQFYDIFKDIEKNLYYHLSDKIRNYVKKQIPPFMILQDIFTLNPHLIESTLSNLEKLKQKVDEACRKRYDETKDRLRRTGVRSFIYILLTKVVFALLLEIPYDLYIIKSISYIPIIINVIFPPALMAVIILTVTVPGDENTRKIYNYLKDIISINPENIKNGIVIGKKVLAKSPVFTAIFSLIYLLTYLFSFGSIIYILTKLNFNPVSQSIFIFFVTLVTFFAFKIINITQEYLVIDKDGPLTPLFDLYFLPIIRVGQWLSGEVLTKFNILIFFFDFLIEMPLKAIVEVVDEWMRFMRLKKEEIV